MKVLIIGTANDWNLEHSYFLALKELGHDVRKFDLDYELKKFIKFGKLGNYLNNFLPIDAWIKKANRNLIVKFKLDPSDIVLVFCNAPITTGALAYMKSIAPVKIVLIWPDTLLNLRQHVINSKSLYDLVACYSKSAIKPLEELGFNKPVWVPLAGDSILFKENNGDNDRLNCDISFIGGFRPEREEAMLKVIEKFPNKNIRIYGFDWKQNCRNKEIIKRWTKSLFYGKEFAKAIRASKVNINIIDETNFPAANMRFFEIPISGGIQISSPCPEFEGQFVNKSNILFHHSIPEMLENIEFVFKNEALANEIKQNAFNFTNANHTYINRSNQIIKELNY